MHELTEQNKTEHNIYTYERERIALLTIDYCKSDELEIVPKNNFF